MHRFIPFLFLTWLCLSTETVFAQEYRELNVSEITKYIFIDNEDRKMLFLETFAESSKGKTLIEEAYICMAELGSNRLTRNPQRIYESLSRFAILTSISTVIGMQSCM